jgi:hypothetical protein
MIRFVFVCLFAAWLAVGALAQTEKAEPKSPPIKIPVWVEEAEDRFWTEGKRQSFRVFLDDREVPLRSFQGPRNSTILLIVFDTVADLSRVDQVRTLLAARINRLSGNTWVGLLRAQDGLSVLQEPGGDRAALAGKIQAIPVSGKAGLLDTLDPVLRLATGMQRKAGVRLSVLYVTDGGIANYRADYLNPVINSSDAGDLSRRFSDRAVQEQMSRVAESLAPFTIPLFILHLEQRTDAMNLAYQSGLERIAARSGGATRFCRTNDEIQPALDTLFARIESAYVLGFDRPAGRRKVAKLRVEAAEAAGKRVRHVEQLTLGDP